MTEKGRGNVRLVSSTNTGNAATTNQQRSTAGQVNVKANYNPAQSAVKIKKKNGTTVGANVGETAKRVKETVSTEVEKARERMLSKWMFGHNANTADYIRLVVMTLLTVTVFTFFTGMLRGYNPNLLSYGIGMGLLRFAVTSTTYSETKGLLDPFLVGCGIWVGRVTWKFGLVMIATEIAGSATGYGMVHAFNPTGAIIIQDGAALIGPVWLPYPGLALVWEFLAFFLVAMALFWSYGLRKLQQFYKKMIAVNGGETWSAGDVQEKEGNWRRMSAHKTFMGAPTNVASALSVGFTAGVVCLIGFSITGSCLDFFGFLWPTVYTGLIMSYPNWWIYLVGPLAGVFAICLFWSIAIRLVRWSYEYKVTTKKVTVIKTEVTEEEIDETTVVDKDA